MLEVPKWWRRWGRGWPPRNTSLPIMYYRAEFGRFRSKGVSVLTEIGRKIGFLASRLSRSLKVMGTDTERLVSYDIQWSISKYGPISYRFGNKRRFRLKFAKFFTHPVHLMPTLSGSAWNFVTAAGLKKLQEPRSKKFDDMCTDRQKW